ncbi:hypothetical protein M569_08878 [Genlisea aurea]|uniref:Uncharacterized protein n=1 Tax=Genlisea aurea TaxID=192259 RepID=S8CG65_9LAMI|nr:hypothetical protein M569_08878 [Genlisea aurea]
MNSSDCAAIAPGIGSRSSREARLALTLLALTLPALHTAAAAGSGAAAAFLLVWAGPLTWIGSSLSKAGRVYGLVALDPLFPPVRTQPKSEARKVKIFARRRYAPVGADGAEIFSKIKHGKQAKERDRNRR